MTKLEQEQFEKQVYENQETAIKLLQENVLLNYEVQTLKKTLEEKETKIDELESEREHFKKQYEDLECDLRDNYVPRYKTPYEEYGVSERDFY